MDPNRQSFYVGVKALILKDGKILVVRDLSKNKWELPGGRIDQGQSFEEALKRELQEEIGSKLTELKQISGAAIGDFTVENDHKLCLLFFEAIVEVPEVIQLSDEHTDVKWATADEIAALDMFTNDQAAAIRYLKEKTNV